MKMGYPIISFVLLFAVVWFGANWHEAQENERVLECLGEVDAPWFPDIYNDVMSVACLEKVNALWISDLRHLEGENFWLGYERGGFDVPGDVYLACKLRGTGEQGQDIMVWIAYAPSTPEVSYWLPFAKTTLYADANGEHYGPHPCGAFRVADRDGD